MILVIILSLRKYISFISPTYAYTIKYVYKNTRNYEESSDSDDSGVMTEKKPEDAKETSDEVDKIVKVISSDASAKDAVKTDELIKENKPETDDNVDDEDVTEKKDHGE